MVAEYLPGRSYEIFPGHEPTEIGLQDIPDSGKMELLLSGSLRLSSAPSDRQVLQLETGAECRADGCLLTGLEQKMGYAFPPLSRLTGCPGAEVSG